MSAGMAGHVEARGHLLFRDSFFRWPRTCQVGWDCWAVSPGNLIYPFSDG